MKELNETKLDDNSVKYTVNSMIYGSIQVAWSTEEFGFLINRLTCPGQCRGLYEDRQGLGHHHRWVRHSKVMRIKKIHGLITTLRKKPQTDHFRCLNAHQKHVEWILFHHVSAQTQTPSPRLSRTSGISSVTMSTMWAGVMSSSLSGPESCFFPRLRFSFLFFFSFFFFSALSFCRRSSSSFTYWSDMGRPVCD